MLLHDSQRSRLYTWEQLVVAPHDKVRVPFAQVTAIVAYVWDREGLQHPPIVERLPKQVKTFSADALRTKLRFPDTTHTWIILHELAHAMTSDIDNRTDQHGPIFLGIYMQLCHRYLCIPIGELASTAAAANLQFDLTAKPVFL